LLGNNPTNNDPELGLRQHSQAFLKASQNIGSNLLRLLKLKEQREENFDINRYQREQKQILR
jgi:hypothetical protein